MLETYSAIVSFMASITLINTQLIHQFVSRRADAVKFPHRARYPNNWNNGTQLASERFIRWYAKHKPRPREINLSATKGGMGGNVI